MHPPRQEYAENERPSPEVCITGTLCAVSPAHTEMMAADQLGPGAAAR
jgi:hypothetical protein